jgi:single-strand DNA-binding protein
MVSLNRLMLIGNVGTDPEMRYTPNGKAVTTFRLAVTRRFNGQDGERQDDTEWFTTVTWNALAEQCSQWLTKGRRVFIEGRLKSNTWTGADGVARFGNEVIASRVLFLDRGENQPNNSNQQQPAAREPVAAQSSAQPPSEEDLPW